MYPLCMLDTISIFFFTKLDFHGCSFGRSSQMPFQRISVYEEGEQTNFPIQCLVVKPTFDQMQQDPHGVVCF